MKTIFYYLKSQIDLPTFLLLILSLVWTSSAFLLNPHILQYSLSILFILSLRLFILSFNSYYIDNFSNNLYNFSNTSSKFVSHKKINYNMNFIYIAVIVSSTAMFIFSIIKGQSYINSLLITLSIIITAQPKNIDTLINFIIVSNLKTLNKKHIYINSDISILDSCKNINRLLISKDNILVKNKMKVVKIYDHISEISKSNPEKLQLISTLFNMCSTCNNSSITPLELALLNFSKDNNINNDFIGDTEKISEIPFTNDRKLMTSIYKVDDGHFLTITKGSIELILDKSVYTIDNSDNIEFSNSIKSKTSMLHGKMAGKGLSVIGIAFKHWDFSPNLEDVDSIEINLIFVGMVGLNYYIKSDAKKHIDDCYKLDVKPILISGEHSLTAKSIANRIGFLKGNSKTISGNELESLEHNELMLDIDNIQIFSRLSDSHRERIYKTFKNKGNIVGVLNYTSLDFVDNNLMFYINDEHNLNNGIKINSLNDVIEVIARSRCLDNRIKFIGDMWKFCIIGELLLFLICLMFGQIDSTLSFEVLFINIVIYILICILK